MGLVEFSGWARPAIPQLSYNGKLAALAAAALRQSG
jgi:hypothetical protein